jgi:hypothetical protein
VGRFQRLLYDTGQVVADGIQVRHVFQAGCERGHGLVGVVAGPVEPAVHHVLHPQPQRVEQGRRSQGRCGHGHWRVDVK